MRHSNVDTIAPPGVTVEYSVDALRITRRWFHPLAFVVVAALALGAILYGLTGRAGSRVLPALATAANVLTTIFGVLCLYLLCLVLFNRTTVEVTAEHVRFSHGPLPWILPRRGADSREIAHLYCEEHWMHFGIAFRDYDYELKARLKDGRSLSLLEDIPNRRQADYLRQEIEHKLGIAGAAAPREESD
jgi:hypothetical protein